MSVGLALGVSAIAKGVTGVVGASAKQRGYNRADAILKESEKNFQPYADVGTGALDALAHSLGLANSKGVGPNGQDYSEFFKSPGYQFRLDEGLKAVQRSAAAKGILQSGGTLKGIDQYAEGLASQEFGNYQSKLFSLAGMGQSAAGSLANIAANRANIQMGKGATAAEMWGGLGDTVGQTAGNFAAFKGLQVGQAGTAGGRVDTSMSSQYGPLLPGGAPNIMQPDLGVAWRNG